MEMLRSLLEKEHISSKEDLDQYIKAHYEKKTDSPFQILKKDDIPLDREDRIYDSKISYERVIFDVPLMRIANSESISFKDCIFTGELLINQNIDSVSSIYLDYCVIVSSLKISGIQGADSLILQNVNTPAIEIFNSTINEVSIATSRTAHLLVAQSCIGGFGTFCNQVGQLDFCSNEFEAANFDMDQLDIRNQPPGPNQKQIEQAIKKFNAFMVEVKIDYDRFCDKEAKLKRNETFRFLKKYSDASLNRELWGELSYRHALATQPNWLIHGFQKCMGAFIKPKRIFVLITASLLLFGLVYRAPVFKFATTDAAGQPVVRRLFWSEAFYYSGISFTTIGYGDISPVGLARWVSIAEGLVGVFLVSSWVVSLTRKYVE